MQKYRRVLLISTNPELSDRNVSRQSRFLRQAFIQWNYDSLFFLTKEEETSLMRHERRTYME